MIVIITLYGHHDHTVHLLSCNDIKELIEYLCINN